MPVIRYRSIEEMPFPWRDADDPANLRMVARMLTLYRIMIASRMNERRGVRRFRSLQEANASRNDPYRR